MALPVYVNLLRIVAQGLVPATRASTPVEAVRAQMAIQGQQVSAVPHALILRSEAGGSDVRRAFDTHQLVRSWPMRGTVHITTADDHHWIRVTLNRNTDSRFRHERMLGIDDAVVARCAEIARQAIAELGPLTRSQMFELWAREGFEFGTTPAERDDQWAVSSWRRAMIGRMDRDGFLAQGPVGVNEHLLFDAGALPSAESEAGGISTSGAGSNADERALAEVALRYARSHGPVTAADLSRWASVPVTSARKMLENAVEVSATPSLPVTPPSSIPSSATGTVALPPSVPLVRVGVEKSGLVPLDTPRSAADFAHTYYMRADLEDLLADSLKEAKATFYLPSFDELHVGYKDRTCLTDEAGELLICPAKNGMFRPIVMDRGRLVAVNPVKEGLLWKKGEPSKRLERDVNWALASVGKALAS